MNEITRRKNHCAKICRQYCPVVRQKARSENVASIDVRIKNK